MTNPARLPSFDNLSKDSETDSSVRQGPMTNLEYVVISGTDVLRFGRRTDAEWAVQHLHKVFPEQVVYLLPVRR